ncbi:MAG: hypothetical protein JO182_14515 [Acidobacteriaceae bacterium]|nr:hypothetical protein [Acidobacteriaceae bacterium]MBV9035700.1 hypothetical protein [Acidobacteriaceae bacterium]MBV9227520.1 hypothetical protein [Acidobacteriaceae bacterium]MBV9304783.1 hypothetical protein [Acidobacteriaceae bacterium]MBV9679133.1 hypothetical protein [Acidobacteriaceae bacterium]
MKARFVLDGFLVLGVFVSLTSLALAAGVKTRLAALLFCLGIAAETVWVAPKADPDRFLLVLLSGSMALALMLLGPGAFSFDAKKFGRHEIVIAPSRQKL